MRTFLVIMAVGLLAIGSGSAAADPEPALPARDAGVVAPQTPVQTAVLTPMPGRPLGQSLPVRKSRPSLMCGGSCVLLPISHMSGPENGPSACTSAATEIVPVKCGTMPTACVSHIAAIFTISVMPPTFGSVLRM